MKDLKCIDMIRFFVLLRMTDTHYFDFLRIHHSEKELKSIGGYQMARIHVLNDPSGHIIISFPYDPLLVEKVKSIADICIS